MIGPNNMTMMYYDNYDGAYGYVLIIIRLYHPFFWDSMAPCSLLSQLYSLKEISTQNGPPKMN